MVIFVYYKYLRIILTKQEKTDYEACRNLVRLVLFKAISIFLHVLNSSILREHIHLQSSTDIKFMFLIDWDLNPEWNRQIF